MLEGCATTWVSLEVTIGVTIHDRMFNLRLNGVGERHLRCKLWEIFGKILCQESINSLELGGMVEIEFKSCYKTHRASL